MSPYEDMVDAIGRAHDSYKRLAADYVNDPKLIIVLHPKFWRGLRADPKTSLWGPYMLEREIQGYPYIVTREIDSDFKVVLEL